VTPGALTARGLTFPTLAAGDGPLVLCLHGFPDHPRSFRHQLPALAAAGYRAVAPTMRGYTPSAIPPDGRYQTAVLGEDVVAWIDALGYDEAILVGHDWGAIVAYAAALAAPRRVRKLITMGLPYGMQFVTAFSTSYEQQKRSWYMFFFQSPLAELAVAHDDFRFLERLWCDWSPGWEWPREEMAALKETFRKPGVLSATLGYYRALFDPAFQDPEYAERQGKMNVEPIDVPALTIHGVDDGCIGCDLVDGMAAYFPRGLATELIPEAGHFVHQERPAVVNRLALDFLAR
jgi:pimeloyl-ACP methyl ester carboxylesterase